MNCLKVKVAILNRVPMAAQHKIYTDLGSDVIQGLYSSRNSIVLLEFIENLHTNSLRSGQLEQT